MDKTSGTIIILLLAVLLFWVAFNKKLPDAISNFKTAKTLRSNGSFRGVGSTRSW